MKFDSDIKFLYWFYFLCLTFLLVLTILLNINPEFFHNYHILEVDSNGFSSLNIPFDLKNFFLTEGIDDLQGSYNLALENDYTRMKYGFETSKIDMIRLCNKLSRSANNLIEFKKYSHGSVPLTKLVSGVESDISNLENSFSDLKVRSQQLRDFANTNGYRLTGNQHTFSPKQYNDAIKLATEALKD